MNSIAPVWDGNETWLVLGGGGLLAAFPACVCDHPAGDPNPLMIAMLLGLVFSRRGVRIPLARCGRTGHTGMLAFYAGLPGGGRSRRASRLARSSRGNFASPTTPMAGAWLDWLSPFTLLTGAALVPWFTRYWGCIMAGVEDRRCGASAMRAAWPSPSGIATLIAMARRERGDAPFCITTTGDAGFTVSGAVLSDRASPIAGSHHRGGVFLEACAAAAEAASLLDGFSPSFCSISSALGISVYPYLVPRPSHYLGCRRASAKSGIHVGRNRRHIPDHPRLHRLGILGISRQRPGTPRVSLMRPAVQFLEANSRGMIAIWTASVAAVLLVSLFDSVSRFAIPEEGSSGPDYTSTNSP